MWRKEWFTYTVLVCFVTGIAIIAIGGETMMKEGPGAFMSDYASSSDFFSNMSGMKMGKSPHGEVQIYYSSNVKVIIDKASFVVPVGTVSIKPFNNDGKPGIDGIAVMIKKKPGYDSQNNDWYYEMRDAQGNLSQMPTPGKIEMCIGCHAAASSKDYLAGTDIR